VTPDLDRLRAGAAACPSDLALDRLQAGELGPSEMERVQGHASSCAACEARLAERRAGFAAYAGLDERKLLAGIRRGLESPPPRRAFMGRAMALLAVACALGLGAVVAFRQPVEPALRSKGGLALHVFRSRAGTAVATVSGDTFAPGDRLEFVVDLPSAGYVQILGVEQSGALYTAWPLDAAPSKLEAGTGIALPGAVALDGSLGRESLFLVHCPGSAGPPHCTAGPTGAPACPVACAMTRFALEKRR